MTNLWRNLSYEKCNDWLGWRGKVLIDERLQDGKVIGRNYAYKPIVFKTEERLGNFVEVMTTEARSGYLMGNIIKRSHS